MSALPPKKKIKSISKWKKELDTIFSIYIRTRDKGQCYTCPRKDEIKKMQNGHFNPRQYLSTRWDERNNNCQCYVCNMLYNGQPSRYAQHLIEDYGPNIINELEKDRLKPVKLDAIWYLNKIEEYKEKLALLNQSTIIEVQ